MDDLSGLERLSTGDYAATDDAGHVRTFHTRYEAERWLWKANWGRRYDRKASWQDVKRKGLALLEADLVDVYHLDTGSIAAQVLGDSDLYDTFVSSRARVYRGNPVVDAYWSCTCEWGQWCNSGHRPHDGPASTGSVKVQNRFCSHAYACYVILSNYQKSHVDLVPSEYDYSPERNGQPDWALGVR